MKLVLVGGGGHCKSMIEVIRHLNQFQITGVVDRDEKIGESICDVPIKFLDSDFSQLIEQGNAFCITVGQIKDASRRMQLYYELKNLGAKLPNIIAATAYVARLIEIGEGNSILNDCFINGSVSIANNCIINTGAIIEHDAKIGSHVHISTRAVLNGGVHLGDRVFVGSGAVLANDVKVCSDVVIGAGTIVIQDLLIPGTYVGNPARILN